MDNDLNQRKSPLFLWAYVMFLLVLATYFCNPISHPIFYFHMSLGNWIRASGELPRVDLWSAAGSGEPFFAASWLFDVSLSYVEQFFGDAGLIYLKMLLFVIFTGLVASVLSAKAQSRFFGAFLTALVASAVLDGAALSPSLLGWALFFYVVHWVFKLESGASFRTALVRLLLLLVLYSNVHASSLIAALVVILTASLRKDLKPAERGLVAAVAVSAVFCTPYMGANIAWQFGAFLQELAYHGLLHPEAGSIFHFSTAFMLIFWVLLLVALRGRGVQIDVSELALVSVLSFAALAARSYTPYAIIALAYVLAGYWGRSGGDAFENLGVGLRTLQEKLASWDMKGIVWVLFCLVIVNTVQIQRLPRSISGYPVLAMDYVVDRAASGPVLSDSRFGPYISFRASPQGRDGEPLPVVDFRTPFLNFELAKNMALFERNGSSFSAYFEQAKPRSILCLSESLLCEIAERDVSWRKVFEWNKALDDPEQLPDALRKGRTWTVFEATQGD